MTLVAAGSTFPQSWFGSRGRYQPIASAPNQPDTLLERGRKIKSCGHVAVYYIKQMSVNGIHFPEAIFVKTQRSAARRRKWDR